MSFGKAQRINFDNRVSTKKKSDLSFFKAFKPEEFLDSNKIPILVALFGLILLGFGIFLYKNTSIFEADEIEIVDNSKSGDGADAEMVVEIAGSVEKPGVYKLKSNSRIEDLLVSCGGLSAEADRDWVSKYINRAARLSDGQKIYIKSVSETQQNQVVKQTDASSAKNEEGYQSVSTVLGTNEEGLTNINTATFTQLDALPGIGQVYGQKIIEQRPYSNTEDLLNRGILPKSTYEKIKDKITVY